MNTLLDSLDAALDRGEIDRARGIIDRRREEEKFLPWPGRDS